MLIAVSQTQGNRTGGSIGLEVENAILESYVTDGYESAGRLHISDPGYGCCTGCITNINVGEGNVASVALCAVGSSSTTSEVEQITAAGEGTVS